jgi:hypothetical protein
MEKIGVMPGADEAEDFSADEIGMLEQYDQEMSEHFATTATSLATTAFEALARDTTGDTPREINSEAVQSWGRTFTAKGVFDDVVDVEVTPLSPSK